MLVCASTTIIAHGTVGRIGRPASLRPLIGRAGNLMANLGRVSLRECEAVSLNVIARSTRDEAIQLSFCRSMDCFACARNDGIGVSAFPRWADDGRTCALTAAAHQSGPKPIR